MKFLSSPWGILVGSCLSAGLITFGIQILTRKKTKQHVSKNKIFVVVFTGGPCAGKTSILEPLKKALKEMNMVVLSVPEVSTLMMENGARFPGVNAERPILLNYEKILMQLQLNLESTFLELGHAEDRPAVVLVDRGALDIAAYMPKDLWDELLHVLDTNESSLLSRYDLICHLVTAADGARQFFTNSNNEHRYESADEAVDLDYRLRKCWKQHQNVKIIDNSTTFDGKINRALDAIIIGAKNHFHVSI